jgi:Nucleotidyltransferase of unknown function (DUF6036)
MSAIEEFLRDVDRSWRVPTESTKIRLDIIGASALRLQTELTRGTKDSDVLQTNQLTDEIQAALIELAGVDTALHGKHRLYIEVVSQGVPFLAHAPKWHELAELSASLMHFDVRVLDIVDVVVSKLKPFRASDRQDIDEMIEAGRVPHDQLIERFEAAFDRFIYDARVSDLPAYVANLNAVEEDSYGVAPTPLETPDWADR